MKKTALKRWIYLTFFIVIEIVMSLTPFLGFIPLGVINATTLHLPVIIAGILLGKREGLIVGFVFGLISLLRATFAPNLTSFVFSPFISVGNIDGQWTSLIVVFVPRMLMGYCAGSLMKIIPFKNTSIKVIISAFIASLINTALVLLFILLFFKVPYAQAIGQQASLLFNYLLGLFSTIGIIEALVAVTFALPIYLALHTIIGGNKHA